MSFQPGQIIFQQQHVLKCLVPLISQEFVSANNGFVNKHLQKVFDTKSVYGFSLVFLKSYKSYSTLHFFLFIHYP